VDKLFEWLANNPLATHALIAAFGLLVVSVTVIYLVAFLQGREISFWPPKIGAKPEKSKSKKADEAKDAHPTQFGPIIQSGVQITAASGNSFTIEANLYSGATATLFRAESSAHDTAIVKVYWRGIRPNSPPWEFFNREYRSAEILAHRNIAKVIDRGLFSGYPFIVMEYFAGGTLRELLDSRDRIPGPDILSIAGQVADAIDFMHSHGVIHRDIKPENLLLESDPHGRIALSDFGIAQILGADEIMLTPVHPQFIGSPAYLAPEALAGEEITTASDIYSFGVVLFEMIVGRVPFGESDGVWAMVQAKRNKEAPDICSFRPSIPEEIATRLAQTLSRDWDKRPRSARSVLSGIEEQISRL
jgi:serine/threonine-protein kinase